MPNKNVINFLQDLALRSPNLFNLVDEIRQLFLKLDPHLSEEIKYGGILFGKNNQHFSGIFVYKAHLSIEFSQGATLPDAEKRLEGSGNYRRHIKITCIEDIQSKKAADFIKLALENI